MIDDTLPQELVDLIVDNLSEDKSALLSLLNASRIFGGRVRTHLYRRVNLVVDYSYSRPSQYALSTRSEQFLYLISSAAAIGDAVMELTCDITPVLVEPSLRFSPYWKHVRDVVVRLRRLDVIHIENRTALADVTYVSYLTTALASSTVSKIHVQGTFVAPRCVVHFLSAFPNVTALHLEDVFHNSPKTTIAEPLIPLPPLNELLVQKSSAFTQAFGIEEFSIALSGLRRLVLLWFQEVNWWNDWEVLNEILGYAGIQELYLQLTKWTTNLDHGVHNIARVPHLTIQLPDRSPFVSWLTEVC
ncbi:hypothetical protein BDZ89DRAFT_259770 [Hymenopellis radicata]|nr:hypothetical protein BDZ89DRAFT_259770 [Hymenopellis radicata]